MSGDRLFQIRRGPPRTMAAFTIVELLASCAVLLLLLLMIMGITGITSKMWRDTAEKMQSFEGARNAFDQIATTLSQAILNPYWEYDDVGNPTRYERCSELQFLSAPMESLGRPAARYPTHGLFFQALTGTVADKAAYGGMPSLLNAFGYFIEYGDDTNDRPSFLPPTASLRYRYRLKEWRVPSEKIGLYAKTSGTVGKNYAGATSTDWIDLTAPLPSTLAENVIALVFNPLNPPEAAATTGTPLTDDFVYNSRTDLKTPLALNQRNQIPPEVEIIMVAVSEGSMLRAFGNPSDPPNLVSSDLFKIPSQVEIDLKALTDRLDEKRIQYRVLRSSVKIRSARWSQD